MDLYRVRFEEKKKNKIIFSLLLFIYWSNNFVTSINNLQEVDGDSLLLLQQSDLLNFLHIKLGPAVKIFNSILAVRAASQ